jgi:hypothetical protein
MSYHSENISTEHGTEPLARVEGDTATGLVTLGFYGQDGRMLYSETMSWAAARYLARALFDTTEAITDVATAEMDAEMAKHAHVSARWLGDMGREQRSN